MRGFRVIINWLARVLRVDLVDLAAEDASYDPALAVDRFFDALEDTERFDQVEDDVKERAASKASVDALLQQLAARGVERPAAGHVSDQVLLDELVSRDAERDVVARLDDDTLVDIVEQRGLAEEFDTGPLQSVKRLDDDPSTVYLHLLDRDADQGAYADRLDRIFTSEFGHSPRALHVPLTELTDLREVDPSYFAEQAAPWLKQAEAQPAVEGGDA